MLYVKENDPYMNPNHHFWPNSCRSLIPRFWIENIDIDFDYRVNLRTGVLSRPTLKYIFLKLQSHHDQLLLEHFLAFYFPDVVGTIAERSQCVFDMLFEIKTFWTYQEFVDDLTVRYPWAALNLSFQFDPMLKYSLGIKHTSKFADPACRHNQEVIKILRFQKEFEEFDEDGAFSIMFDDSKVYRESESFCEWRAKFLI